MRWLVVDVNPEPWAIGPVGVSRKGSKLIPYVGRNQQLNAFKESVAEAIKADYPDLEMIQGRVRLVFYFWRNRAAYKTPSDMVHQKHEADLTNLQKATEDALQGILFFNDKVVNDVRSTLVEQNENVRGRIVIGFEPSPLLPPSVLELPDAVGDLLDSLDENKTKGQSAYDSNPEELF